MKRFLIFFYNLSLKKVLGLALLLALLLSIPMTFLQLQRESRIFTEAGNESNSSTVDESNIPYPSEPPQILHVAKFYGKPGDSVLIYGQNFGEAKKESQVLLNNKPLDDSLILYWSNSEIEFSLPDSAGLYQIGVLINDNKSFWFGKVNLFNELTLPEITINDETNFIRVPDDSYALNIYSLTDNVRVFGTENYEINQKDVPLEIVESNFLYIEVSRDGVIVPYRVSNP